MGERWNNGQVEQWPDSAKNTTRYVQGTQAPEAPPPTRGAPETVGLDLFPSPPPPPQPKCSTGHKHCKHQRGETTRGTGPTGANSPRQVAPRLQVSLPLSVPPPGTMLGGGAKYSVGEGILGAAPATWKV